MTCSNNATLNVKAGSSKLLIILLAILHFSLSGFSQVKEGADSLVYLLEAQSAHLVEIDSVAYRKIIGPATFLHNNTYLKCDTALWNVKTNIIDALGHVEITQKNTLLLSDRIEYSIAEDVARFRGDLVQLLDNNGNVLNTNYLDYNTKDSIATFFNGAALKSEDGNFIESVRGMYFSKEKLFSFRDSVQMFTDSVFIVTERADYHTDTDVAVFGKGTVAWRENNMLSASSGNFNRRTNVFTFDKDGYILTQDQELWADLLKYHRNTGFAELYHNVQILDTVQTAICMADKVTYTPDPQRIDLEDNPVVGLYSVENDVPDTLFLRADAISYYTKRKFEIDSSQIDLAKQRVRLSAVDPIAIHDAERRVALQRQKENRERLNAPPKKQESVSVAELYAHADTVAVVADTLVAVVPPKDTTEVTFIDAFHNVLFYRSDIQGKCDSLVFCGLDSMARFYSSPVMWYNGVNQFTADSIQAIVGNKELKKINLLSEAFIAMQEDTLHYNQIKSAEMAAFFSGNELYRFDALGGVSAIFYIEEDSTITLMDKEECKMLTARIKDNQIQRTRSISDLKQNVFPVFNLPIDDQRLKGFQWRGDERPASRFDVTPRIVRPGRRKEMMDIPLPEYKYILKYFEEDREMLMEYQKKVGNRF